MLVKYVATSITLQLLEMYVLVITVYGLAKKIMTSNIWVYIRSDTQISTDSFELVTSKMASRKILTYPVVS